MAHLLIYHESALATGLEWATKYHTADTADPGARAAICAGAEAELVSDFVTFTRWESYSIAGIKVAEGVFSPLIIGDRAGDMQPIKYAMLIRLVSTINFKRPSSRYIHGWTEDLQTQGSLNATGAAAVAGYNTALAGTSWYVDSDGSTIAGHTFRGFTKRKRMRRKVI